MKVTQISVCVATILFLTKTSKGIKNIKPKIDANVETFTVLPYTTTEGESETTTEFFEYENISTASSLEKTTNIRSMTLKKNEEEEEGIAVVESPNVLEVNFPENHKNFTASQYLGTGESPYYVYVNPYKQQYESYYEHKELYNRKPIKFEDNTQPQHYLIPQKSVYNIEEARPDYSRLNVKPFPYAFENHQITENLADNVGIEHHGVYESRPTYWDYSFDPSQQNLYLNDFPKKLENNFDFTKTDLHQVGHHDNFELGKYYKNKNPWKKVLHFLTALVPLGLFLATLTPNVISVNASSPGKITKQRSSDSESDIFKFKEEDIIKLAKKYGFESLSESQCEDRIICELAKMGENSMADSIEKGFLYLAHKTPRDVAARAGMTELFDAIKTGTCEIFKCDKESGANSTSLPVRKKVLRKRKIQRKVNQ